MTEVVWGTHDVQVGADRVLKRFHGDGRADQAAREWRALRLLASYAPELAPEPLEADLDGERPTVVMSRVPGRTLRGGPLDRVAVAWLADAVTRMHGAVPPDVLAGLPRRAGTELELVELVRGWEPRVRAAGGVVGEALERALMWLDDAPRLAYASAGVAPVFGLADGNLANYLADGVGVRIVDFEDSGVSDRAFELAEITEHVASWVEHPLDVEVFLGRFELTADEQTRLVECRRLLALFWLCLLAVGEAERPRNPPGTVQRQAVRLGRLLP